MSNECSNSQVNDSIVLAGLGRGDDCGYASSVGGGGWRRSTTYVLCALCQCYAKSQLLIIATEQLVELLMEATAY